MSPRGNAMPGAFWRGSASERFADRREAGGRLARLVAPLVKDEDVVVLALPRGGVPVVERRERLYRNGRPPADVRGKTVVVGRPRDRHGSDRAGGAAGARAAGCGAARRIVACPAAPPQTVASLREEADDVVCVGTPDDLGAIGFWYADFAPVTDEEVVRALRGEEERRET